MPSQTVEEETQKAREDVKRAIKQRATQQTAAAAPGHVRADGDFDQVFGTGHAVPPPAVPASSASPVRGKPVTAVHVQRSTSANRQQHVSPNRSLSAKRADSQQQQRPSSAKASAKPSSSSGRSARPTSAPAPARDTPAAAAAVSHDLDLDASSAARLEPAANAAQVMTFAWHLKLMLFAPAPAPPQPLSTSPAPSHLPLLLLNPCLLLLSLLKRA